MDPHINPETGVWDDNYYAAMYGNGGGGGGGGMDINSILNNAMQPYIDMVKKQAEWETANPFSFDENLARESSTKEYAPYYEEQLTDYVSGIEKQKSRSSEDLTKTLDYLNAGKESYLGEQRRILDKAIRNTNEGYAGRGLYMSGVRGRDLRELETENKSTIADYMRGYNYQTSNAQLSDVRKQEDLDLAKRMYGRDIEREKKYAVESGILQRKSEAKEEYEQARSKYYNDLALNVG